MEHHDTDGNTEGGRLNFVLAASMADGTQRFVQEEKMISSIQHLQQAGCITLLVGMPHEKAHCPMTVNTEHACMAHSATTEHVAKLT